MKILLRIFAIVAALLMLRSLLAPLVRALSGWLKPAPGPPASAREASRPASELKKDPVCGAFVAAELALTRKVNGKTLHFCSAKCRDEYGRTA